MKIKGVDISHWQKGIDFSALKQAGVQFAIIRAGYSTKKDDAMDKFIEDCSKHGIYYGFYWYSYAMSIEQVKYYDAFYILFHTGLRISEFCGLTTNDLDMENRVINIDHQLQRTSKMEYVIETPIITGYLRSEMPILRCL